MRGGMGQGLHVLQTRPTAFPPFGSPFEKQSQANRTRPKSMKKSHRARIRLGEKVSAKSGLWAPVTLWQGLAASSSSRSAYQARFLSTAFRYLAQEIIPDKGDPTRASMLAASFEHQRGIHAHSALPSLSGPPVRRVVRACA
jgi:hypothetical protein